MRLKSQLPKLVDVVPVDSSRCNHVDFLWSLEVTKQVNVKVTEILQKTDHPDWEFTGPPAGPCEDITTDNDGPAIKGQQPNSTNDHHELANFVLVPEYSSGVTPVQRDVDDDESADLAREQRLQQKVQMFGNLIMLFKSTETKYQQLRNGLTREFSEWTRGARNVIGTRHLVGSDSAVVVAEPEDTPPVGCAIVEKTEQPIMESQCTDKVSDFGDYRGGPNHMDDRTATARAFYTTFGNFGRAIRFLKFRHK